MKKITISLVLAAMSVSTAFCDSLDNNEEISSSESSAYDALYVGAGVGGSFLKYEDDGDGSAKANRVTGVVVLGGGKDINGVYLGAEGEYDFASKKKDKGCNFQRAHPKLFGVFGKIIRDWLVYGKAGVAFNKEDLDYNGVIASKSKTGFVAGLGVRKVVNNVAFGVAGDYNFGSKNDGIKFNKGFSVNVHAMYQIRY